MATSGLTHLSSRPEALPTLAPAASAQPATLPAETDHLQDDEAVLEKGSMNEAYKGEAIDRQYAKHGEQMVVDWTPEEEKKVRLKLDFSLLVLLALGFFVFEFHRGNGSYAIADTWRQDTGITLNDYNTGRSLYFAGLLILEIPANLVLLKLGPSLWIGLQVILFGFIGLVQVVQSNKAEFYAFRFLLGTAECGYIPGMLYVLSCFYKKNELATRVSIVWLGSGLAVATAGLIASGILPLRGTGGFAGWQWLFIVEGAMAIFIGFLLLGFLPVSIEKPRPRLSNLVPAVKYFSEQETHIIRQRMINQDLSQSFVKEKIKVKDVLRALVDWRIVSHLFIPLTSGPTTSAFYGYAPRIISSFGFTVEKASALNSINGWTNMVVMIFVGYFSDKLSRKGWAMIIAYTIYAVLWTVFSELHVGQGKWTQFAELTLIGTFNHVAIPINNAWCSLNQPTPQRRAIAMPMLQMATAVANLIGSQILRAEDAPLYITGFRVTSGLAWATVLVCIILLVQYTALNRYAIPKRDVDRDDTYWDRHGYVKNFKFVT